LRIGSIPVGRSRPRQHLTGLQLVPPTAAGALGDERALVLGNGSANLQEQLIRGIIGNWPVDKFDATAMALEFLHQQHLMNVVASETIGIGDEDVIELSERSEIAELVESGSSEGGSGVAIVAEDAILGERPLAIRRELPEAIELLFDGLGLGLTLGRDPHVNRNPHDRTPDEGQRRRQRRRFEHEVVNAVPAPDAVWVGVVGASHRPRAFHRNLLDRNGPRRGRESRMTGSVEVGSTMRQTHRRDQTEFVICDQPIEIT